MDLKKILLPSIVVITIYIFIGIAVSTFVVSKVDYVNPCGKAELRPNEIAGVCPHYIGDKNVFEKLSSFSTTDIFMGIIVWPLYIVLPITIDVN